MRPNAAYTNLSLKFWANVKFISEQLGYSARGKGAPRKYGAREVIECYRKTGLNTKQILDAKSEIYIARIIEYLNYRAVTLEKHVEPNLMDLEDARAKFYQLRQSLNPQCFLPMNKRRGAQRHHNYFTCLVNILTEQTLGGVNFDDNPRGLIIIEKNGVLLRVFTRWMDGAYPGKQNPVAVWETKEYYNTTSFGSRVADAIYETMLDGMEFAELCKSYGIHIKHYLLVDGHLTWWRDGKSYLCRIIDMLHMGLIDEALFGREIFTRWPQIVASW